MTENKQQFDNSNTGGNPAQGDAADLSGMNPAEVKEYLFNFITTLKLTEQQIKNIDDEKTKWLLRIDLAHIKGQGGLAAEAEKELAHIAEKQKQLIAEAAELKSQIKEMREKLPALAARQRGIDTDLLEQELLMAAGYMPGDEEKARSERGFRELEKSAAADSALEALKAKMRKQPI